MSSATTHCRLLESSIDYTQLVDQVRHRSAGAVVLFLGTVRDLTGDIETIQLNYEAYGAMALRKLSELAIQAKERWTLFDVAIEHRIGAVLPGEIAVAVVVSSVHRKEAFDAAEWLMDEIKKSVPVWKQEHMPCPSPHGNHPVCSPTLPDERPLPTMSGPQTISGPQN